MNGILAMVLSLALLAGFVAGLNLVARRFGPSDDYLYRDGDR